MRILDTREQKSPRFLVEAFPDIVQDPLEVGDYFTGYTHYQNEQMEAIPRWSGHLVEIKIGNDFGIHTEPLERFQDECYRMSCWRQRNPLVQLHAVWVPEDFDHEMVAYRLFMNCCFKYHIWGHIQSCNESLINFLKGLDQSKYEEFEPFLKKSHEEPTLLARMLRQFPGISSPKAIELAANITCSCVPSLSWWFGGQNITNAVRVDIIDTIGRKKNGEPKKLALDLIRWLETGETLR